MNLLTQGIGPNLPEEMLIQPPCIFDFPFSVEVGGQWNAMGSGIGNSSGAMSTALGEYFERRHFYLEVLPDYASSLEQCLKPTEVDKFIKAFNQTAVLNENLSNLAHKQFNMNSVVRLSDLTQCAIPTICISLAYHGNGNDNNIYPSRDTCGCSFHRSAEAAIFGSIKELLERQFLTRFWLTRQCIELLDPDKIINIISITPARNLYKALLKSGDITIIDISDINYPGVCLLAVYGNDDPDRNVHYCAGMSYAKNLTSALEKSILELWQTFRFMNLFRVFKRNPESLQDSYIRHFMNCDTYNTFEEITSNIQCSYLSNSKTLDFNLKGMTQTLRDQNIEGYLYIKNTLIDNLEHTFCKFVCPSLFMHMDNSQNINLDNDYSSPFLTFIDKNRRDEMVPFP